MKKILRSILNLIIIILFIAYIVLAFVDLLTGMKIAISILILLIIRFFIIGEENE